MNKIKDIEEKILIRDLEEKAKKINRKDLEELYVLESYKLEDTSYVSSNWKSYGLIVSVIAFVLLMGIFLFHSQYEGSEEDNYRTLGTELCYEAELDEYRYITIEKNRIKLKCGKETKYIERR